MIDPKFFHNPTAATERPTNRRWLMFALACMTSLMLYLHRFTWNFISFELQDELSLTDADVGVLSSMFNLTYSALQVPSGMAADYFGPHLFVGCIIGCWSLALALQAMAPGFYSQCGARLLFGAAQAGTYPSLTKCTYSWFPQKTRTIVQGFVATFFGRGGGALSPFLFATVLIGRGGMEWRSALWILVGLGMIHCVVFLLLFRNDPEADKYTNEAERRLIRGDSSLPNEEERGEEGPEKEDKSKMLPWGKAFRNRSMQFFVVQQFFNAGADNIYNVYMAQFFLKVKGVDMEEAGIAVAMPLLGGAIGGLLGGYCNDFAISRWGRKWGRRAVGFTGKALACGLMFVAIAQQSAFAAGVALFAVKFFSDWSQPTVWGTCTDLGGKHSATVFGILNTSGGLGGIIFPVVFGIILGMFSNISREAGFFALFTFVAIMYIISALCWFGVDCSKPIEDEEEPTKHMELPTT